MTYGDFIDRRMRDYGINQSELSRMTGISMQGISYIRHSAYRYPQASTLTAICKALDICPDVMMRVIRENYPQA